MLIKTLIRSEREVTCYLCNTKNNQEKAHAEISYLYSDTPSKYFCSFCYGFVKRDMAKLKKRFKPCNS